MKRQISLLGLLILIPALSFAGWVSQNSGAAFALSSVHFPVDAQTGYITVSNGAILKTTDGGANWAALSSGTSNPLTAVCFPVDTQTGWVVGAGGLIRKTTDGGATWTTQASGTSNILNSVYFPTNAQTGYIVGGSGSGSTILKTTDGGIGVEERPGGEGRSPVAGFQASPNPFRSSARISGHEAERFALYDVSGRQVGTCPGDRIGADLAPGVYFLESVGQEARPLRIVKIR